MIDFFCFLFCLSFSGSLSLSLFFFFLLFSPALFALRIILDRMFGLRV